MRWTFLRPQTLRGETPFAFVIIAVSFLPVCFSPRFLSRGSSACEACVMSLRYESFVIFNTQRTNPWIRVESINTIVHCYSCWHFNATHIDGTHLQVLSSPELCEQAWPIGSCVILKSNCCHLRSKIQNCTNMFRWNVSMKDTHAWHPVVVQLQNNNYITLYAIAFSKRHVPNFVRGVQIRFVFPSYLKYKVNSVPATYENMSHCFENGLNGRTTGACK